MSEERPLPVALENRLMGDGIYLTEFERADDGEDVTLEYEVVTEAPTITSREVGVVVRTLLALAEERDWEPGTLEATSTTTDGDRRGTWRVEGEWFRRLGDDLSQVEFSQRVLDTISVPDGER